MSAAEIPLRVLVVEDDDIAADYLCVLLDELGCSASVATDGEQALGILRKSRFDIMLTDWMMPKMDGVELIRQAREALQHYLHVVLLTAPGEERTMRTALEAGADDFLYKPISPTQLQLGLATARRVLELQQRLERRNRALAESTRRVRAAYRQLKSDLEAAGAMQRSLITPDGTTGLVSHASFLQPSIEIGGDSFGVIPLGDATFFFALDVSGHGVPAALNSFALHQRIVQLAVAGAGLPEVAGALNLELLQQPGDSYATALFGLLSREGLTVLRAGHPPPVIIRRNGEAQFAEAGGLPMGIFDAAPFEASCIEFTAGDLLLCYSDGVMESGMGEEDLLTFAAGERNSSVAVAERLGRELTRLRAGSAPPDDISVLAIAKAKRRADDHSR